MRDKYANNYDNDDDDANETGCTAKCADSALADHMDDQQISIDSMQEQITRMRDLIRNMQSGRYNCDSTSRRQYDYLSTDISLASSLCFSRTLTRELLN